MALRDQSDYVRSAAEIPYEDRSEVIAAEVAILADPEVLIEEGGEYADDFDWDSVSEEEKQRIANDDVLVWIYGDPYGPEDEGEVL